MKKGGRAPAYVYSGACICTHALSSPLYMLIRTFREQRAPPLHPQSRTQPYIGVCVLDDSVCDMLGLYAGVQWEGRRNGERIFDALCDGTLYTRVYKERKREWEKKSPS